MLFYPEVFEAFEKRVWESDLSKWGFGCSVLVRSSRYEPDHLFAHFSRISFCAEYKHRKKGEILSEQKYQQE